ncbi:type IV secretory system conjugative DNA transfer family protein [Psychroserpens luteus]|uniref:Type IV secretory system conjugative DNA transfer family protein n=1 Tax=Psychroserpens luteus TaxID=1434066 RepID=A0ABW5ZWS4_9FLAO|nr:type IV secretion system DNA-binding domain-containing protein [Psychroserpens luteus]
MYSPSELATIQFYQWEYLNRGYYLFEEPVDIEPPYASLSSFYSAEEEVIDDGRVPSFLSQALNILNKPKPSKEEDVSFRDVIPNYISELPELVGFRLSFSNDQDITQLRSTEFLNMLSLSYQPISFEIVGTEDSIKIQLVCDYEDSERIQSQLRAYFPNITLQEFNPKYFGFNQDKEIAIADFGLNEEFVRPINIARSYDIDSLTSIIAVFDILKEDEIAVFQILFKGVNSPLAKDIPYAVSDGRGGSFFTDAPEMVVCAKEKVSAPLFSVVMRIAVQGKYNDRSSALAREFTKSITRASSSDFNKLVPLSNEGYNYDFHSYNLHNRLSNRLGCILNSNELSTFVHYPNKTVVSSKLRKRGEKSKLLASEAINQKYSIGLNVHEGNEYQVSLSDTSRLSHTHIIGSTGVGKSTLMVNMILQDIQKGNGCAVFDPHGDVVEDILLRIPDKRKDDVIIIDPSDINYPIGFNILSASSEIEKIVLSSDLVSSFKRYSTAWGDNINAVFSQAIAVFLEHDNGDTLLDLKRFLIEDTFRNKVLEDIREPSILYYWENEYPMVKKGIAPLLTRIDTFLRPKIIRNMLCQNEGVDFNDCINSKKIVLIKLSQGFIGEQNCFLLGSIFLAKFNQVIQGRQALNKSNRHPFYIYLDEFQNMITPSILSILSGARKYGLGLILVHQELSQISDVKILNSVMANPYIRVCFRLGDNDAKKLESGFSYFDALDLTKLSRGEAIMKLGSSSNDFNLQTSLLAEYDEVKGNSIRKQMIENSRNQFAKTKDEVESIVRKSFTSFQRTKKVIKKKEILKPQVENREDNNSKDIAQDIKESVKKKEQESHEIRTHRYLQNLIMKMGQDRNFIGTIESPTADGGRIDVVLHNDDMRIAFEISETNTSAYEVQNIKKCINDKCNSVVVISKNKKHLNDIQKLAHEELTNNQISLVQFIQPAQIAEVLDSQMILHKPKEEMVKGFRVITEYNADEVVSPNSIKSHISKLFRKRK